MLAIVVNISFGFGIDSMKGDRSETIGDQYSTWEMMQDLTQENVNGN